MVIFAAGESENSVLQGLTLTNGNGNYADPDGNGSYYTYGGGVYCQNTSPILKDLIIKDKSGNEGGGGGLGWLGSVCWLPCHSARATRAPPSPQHLDLGPNRVQRDPSHQVDGVAASAHGFRGGHRFN